MRMGLCALLVPLAVGCGDAPAGDDELGESGEVGSNGEVTGEDGPVDDTEATDSADTTTETGTDTGEAGLTYWKDAKAVIDARCVSCHQAGAIAPFALETWEQVENFAPLLGESIVAGSMPPWPPSADCNSFQHDRSLSAEQEALLLGWIDAGYPEGDPADAPEPPPEPEPWEPDLIIELPEPYSPAPGELDDYRCFAIPWPEELTEEQFVVGHEVFPGQPELVHHVITFVADPDEAPAYQAFDDEDPGPGYSCFGGPGKVDWSARWLGDWAPGAERWEAPAGTGVRVLPGSLLIVQVHYSALGGEPQPDLTSLAFQTQPEVERRGDFIPIVNYGWVLGATPMTIPAGESGVTHGVTLARENPIIQYLTSNLGVSPSDELEVWRATLHMHMLGTRAQLTLEEGGEDTCLLNIEDWDFNWQGDYLMEEPQLFGPGDAVRLDCEYDNSPENQPIVDGGPLEPADVGWGDGTLDEMCLGILYMATK